MQEASSASTPRFGDKMMQSTSPRWRRPVLLAVAACLLLASAAIAGHRHRFHIVIPLPGIDRWGNLDFFDLSPVPFKVVVNTRRERVRAVGRGYVNNESHRRAVFRNLATSNQGFFDIPFIELKRDVYVVRRNGRCRAVAVGCIDDEIL